MHILYVTQYYPPHTGGLERVAQDQARAAARVGHKVSVVTFALSRKKDCKDCGVHNEGGVEVCRVRGWHFFDTHFHIPFCLGGIQMLREVFSWVRNADVVHVHDVLYPIVWWAYIVARWYKKPLILTQHVTIVPHSNALVTFIERVVYRVFGDQIFAYSRTIITYQDVVSDFLQSRGVPDSKVRSYGNGVDLKRYHPVSEKEKYARRAALGLPKDAVLILFVGRFVPKKGYDELFDARDSNYELVFVGSGKVPDTWKHTPHVHVVGEKTPEELVDIYAAADMCVVPSRGEVFTLVMQEACASGLPVVVARAPEYARSGIDTSLITLYEPGNVAMLREILIRLAGDPALRKRMGAYGRLLAEERFDKEKNMRNALTVYE